MVLTLAFHRPLNSLITSLCLKIYPQITKNILSQTKTFGEMSSRIKKRSNRIFEKFENAQFANAITSSAKEKDMEF